MRFPGFREPPAKRGVDTLRNIITLSKTSEDLAYIPDRMAAIISRYDSVPLSPEFRTDIYNILATSLDLAEALIDPTYPVEHASAQIAQQMQTLSRVLVHLNHRPSRTGYSILVPSSQTLIGQFGTPQEAEAYLSNLRAMGGAAGAIVVPVKMTSQHAVQPRASAPPPLPQETFMPGSLPPGIIPSQPSPQPSIPVIDHWEETATLQAEKEARVADTTAKLKAVMPTIPTIPSVKERMAKLEKEAAELVKPKDEVKQ